MIKDRRKFIFPAIIPIFVILGCGISCAQVSMGEYKLTSAGDGSISIFHEGRELFKWTGANLEQFEPQVSMQFGFFKIGKKKEQTTPLQIVMSNDAISLKADDVETGSITLSQTGAGNLRVEINIDKNVKVSALNLEFSCAVSDMFWGFGEQYSFVDLRGRKVPIWVSEQGVGRAEKPSMPFNGRLSDTYFPMPYFMDPKQGKGFLVENPEYSEFDLCSSDPEKWSVEVWNGRRVSFLIFPGPKPADVVSQLTGELGRPKSIPPDWAFSGVWIAAQGGIDAVKQRLDSALGGGVPVTALWVQDWVGKRHFGAGNYGVKYRWNLDEEEYPDLDDFIKSLNARGIRFLGYFNPFIAVDYDQFQEAAEKGYAIKDKDGKPYVFQIITFKGTLLDVTNPMAAAWFQGFARKAVELGMSGWMADFGEWLPFDAVVAGGSAPSVHNLYPALWHKLNREALEHAYPDGDYVVFTRSGFTGEQNVVQILWAGDQEADWTETDGLPTVVRAGLTAGLSGAPFFTHDIAGFSGGPSDKELFLRWTELGAFTPFMRTHDGLRKLKNHRFDSDPETLKFFAEFGKIHAALLPYFRSTALEAVSAGLPIIRHTALVDPEWELAFKAHAQWMIGNDMVFAPVVTKGADSALVFLPLGAWEHLFTGEKFPGRQVVEIKAPIGRPAVFVRSGRMADIVSAIRKIIRSSAF